MPKLRPIAFNVTDFGAVGDGVTDNTVAFERAVAAIAKRRKKGGVQLNVPPGLWLTAPFNLTSYMTLFLAEGAVILGIDVSSLSLSLFLSLFHAPVYSTRWHLWLNLDERSSIQIYSVQSSMGQSREGAETVSSMGQSREGAETADEKRWPLMPPLPSYGYGRELPGPRYGSLIHGQNLRDVVITVLFVIYCVGWDELSIDESIALNSHKTTFSGSSSEVLLPLPFSEIFKTSSTFPIISKSKDLLLIATNLLQPPLILMSLSKLAKRRRPLFE
ncbi:hypothetical protein Cgig2_010241 [Carnegiea gigantea]|uniref:Rhamnogalacturonase A/B/Epimerase-like pectate lyase domain-containing protein n=1 Tax=Carnegiea gigantea TaxID=171969 RepID=A0A9Q1GX68_9CARY|nr:hypothetical protein Cgig2_010241 [Carnegiea gigantea]